jgi:hypothetical protein
LLNSCFNFKSKTKGDPDYFVFNVLQFKENVLTLGNNVEPALICIDGSYLDVFKENDPYLASIFNSINAAKRKKKKLNKI